VVECGIEQALHGVRDRKGDAPRVAAPLELVHEPAADRVQVREQVAHDQVQGQGVVEPLGSLLLAQVQARAHVPVDPGAELLELLLVIGPLAEQVGQELHVQAGDLQTEGPASGDHVGQGRLHAHGVVPEDHNAPALEARVGQGRVAPVDQGLHCGLRGPGGQPRVRPGPHVQVREPAALCQRAVDRVGEDDTGPGARVAAGEVKRRVRRELRQQGDQAELREGPGVRQTDEDVGTLGLELAGHHVGFLLTIDQDRRVDHLDR